jgi:DinB superfamily
VNEFLRATYGDPCRRCGYEWSLGPSPCGEIVSSAAVRYAALLAGQNGKREHVELQWNAAAYVTHVADVLRIWADRVAGAALGSSDLILPYDEGELGMVRGYSGLPLAGALWALERAVGDWSAAAELARSAGSILNHPEQGPLGLDDVLRIMAHEIEHHAADLSLIVSA